MIRDAVRRWDAKMGLADDAPWWAEIVAVVFAGGLFWRTGMHVLAAVAVPWVNPELAGNDVTWRSPVEDLRGRRAVALAHLLCAVSAGVALSFWPPLWLAAESVPLAAGATLQMSVLVVDPLVFVIGRASGRMPFRADDPGVVESIERLTDRLLSD